MTQSQHFVQYAAKRPDVGFLIVRLLLANFRRKVVGCTNSGLSAIISVLQNSCNAEITNLDLAALGHENVLRLEISVQNLSVVDVLDCKSHLDEPI